MKFSGIYRGTVVDNEDPFGKARIRVRVFGVFDSVATDHLPWAEYADPLMGGGRNSGGTFIPDMGDKVWVFFENDDHNQPVYFAGAPSMLDLPLPIDEGYPKTRMFKTKAGHIISLNDEGENETIRVIHRTGTWTEYQPDGSIRELVVANYHRTVYGDQTIMIHGNSNLIVSGNSTTSVTKNIKNSSGENTTNDVFGNLSNNIAGNSTTYVVGDSSTTSDGDTTFHTLGDHTTVVNGNVKVSSRGNIDHNAVGNITNGAEGDMVNIAGGKSDLHAGGVVDIVGSKVYLNSGAMGTVPTPDGELVPREDYADSRSNADQLVIITGSTNAAWDEEETPIPVSGYNSEGVWVESEWEAPESKPAVEQPTDIEEEVKEDEVNDEDGEKEPPPTPPVVECENITTVDYNYQLSPNFKLKDLSTGCVFPHPIKAQNGLSVSDIICNLKQLALNVLEPMKAKFPMVSKINSGFRVGGGKSQHTKGMAVDIQVPNWTPKDYTTAIKWCAQNLPYSQLICEHGNSIWIHISFDSKESPPRRKNTTYHPRMNPQYQSGLINYYDNKKRVV